MSLAPALRDVFFLGEGEDARFCLLTHASTPQAKGALLFVPPFAEEMNRCRGMVRMAVQAFAAQGWTVLQMDLHGCGDSAGDFGNASWDGWLADLDRAHDWLRQHVQVPGPQPVYLWSLRAGALLAADWLNDRGLALPWLNWQPVFNGAQYLTQFLRIRLGADLAASRDASQAIAHMRSSLQAGEAISVAGYWLSASVAQGLEQATLRLPSSSVPGPMALLEVGSGETPTLTPVASTWLKKASEAGAIVNGHAVAGAKFWQSVEIETAPALIPASLQALQAWAP